MNKLVPEVIFDRFASRLREKENDLRYIIYAPGGWEKWAQWEMYLCFKDCLIPVVYNGDWKELKKQSEVLADIGLEYPFGGRKRKGNIRPDLFVAAEPFLINWVDVNSWQIKGTNMEDQLWEKYEEAYCHYIELKTEWWNLNARKKSPKKFLEDIDKISRQNYDTLRSYKPKTFMAISIVTFYSGSKKQKDAKFEDLIKEIKGLKSSLRRYKRRYKFLYTHLFDQTFLIGAYRS
ncbi:MAG: hypothetical protein ACE5G9_02495 [Nitrospinales bacterium]